MKEKTRETKVTPPRMVHHLIYCKRYRGMYLLPDTILQHDPKLDRSLVSGWYYRIQIGLFFQRIFFFDTNTYIRLQFQCRPVASAENARVVFELGSLAAPL